MILFLLFKERKVALANSFPSTIKRRGACGERSYLPVFTAQWMRTPWCVTVMLQWRGDDAGTKANRPRTAEWKSLGPCWLGWAAQLIQGLLNLWIKDPSSLSHWSSSSLLLSDKINQTKRQEGFEGFVIKSNLSFTPKVLAWETEQKMLVIEIKLQHRKRVCARPRAHVGGRAG